MSQKTYQTLILCLSFYTTFVQAISRPSKPTVCTIKVKHPHLVSNFTNYFEKKILCKYAMCCADGCCPWYINLAYVIILFMIFLFVSAVIVKCCHNYFRKREEDDLGEHMSMVPQDKSRDDDSRKYYMISSS